MAEKNIQEVIFLKLLGHKSVLIMAIILNQTIIIIRNIQTHFIAVFFFILGVRMTCVTKCERCENHMSISMRECMPFLCLNRP